MILVLLSGACTVTEPETGSRPRSLRKLAVERGTIDGVEWTFSAQGRPGEFCVFMRPTPVMSGEVMECVGEGADITGRGLWAKASRFQHWFVGGAVGLPDAARARIWFDDDSATTDTIFAFEFPGIAFFTFELDEPDHPGADGFQRITFERADGSRISKPVLSGSGSMSRSGIVERN